MAGGECKTTKLTQNEKPKRDKKKGKDKCTENLKKSISNLTQEEQINILLQKYGELNESHHEIETKCRSLQREADQSHKEAERMNLEHSKAILTKSRLEALCRELQRQNKIIKDESFSRLKEEEERRNEVSNKFNSTLSEISNLMEENSGKNSKLREENQKMADKLKDLVTQHQRREEYVEQVMKQREVEFQLAEAKFAKLQLEVTEQKEKLLKERKGILEEMSSMQAKLQEKSMIEVALRTQLNSYSDKFQDLQGTLESSNQVFNRFKKEIDEMNKMIKRLEKETKSWKDKYERSNLTLYKMTTDRSEMEAKMAVQTKQNERLQSLCRALQDQIKELRSQIKDSVPDDNQGTVDGQLGNECETDANAESNGEPVQSAEEGGARVDGSGNASANDEPGTSGDKESSDQLPEEPGTSGDKESSNQLPEDGLSSSEDSRIVTESNSNVDIEK